MSKQIDFVAVKQRVIAERDRLQRAYDATVKEHEIYQKNNMVSMAAKAAVMMKRQKAALDEAVKRYDEVNSAVKP